MSTNQPNANGVQDPFILYQNELLLKKAKDLFDSYEIGSITGTFNDLLFYAINPDCSKDMNKHDVANLATAAIGLLAAITDAYMAYK